MIAVTKAYRKKGMGTHLAKEVIISQNLNVLWRRVEDLIISQEQRSQE